MSHLPVYSAGVSEGAVASPDEASVSGPARVETRIEFFRQPMPDGSHLPHTERPGKLATFLIGMDAELMAHMVVAGPETLLQIHPSSMPLFLRASCEQQLGLKLASMGEVVVDELAPVCIDVQAVFLIAAGPIGLYSIIEDLHLPGLPHRLRPTNRHSRRLSRR